MQNAPVATRAAAPSTFDPSPSVPGPGGRDDLAGAPGAGTAAGRSGSLTHTPVPQAPHCATGGATARCSHGLDARLLALPPEVLCAHVLPHLGLQDLMRLRCVSQPARAALEDDQAEGAWLAAATTHAGGDGLLLPLPAGAPAPASAVAAVRSRGAATAAMRGNMVTGELWAMPLSDRDREHIAFWPRRVQVVCSAAMDRGRLGGVAAGDADVDVDLASGESAPALLQMPLATQSAATLSPGLDAWLDLSEAPRIRRATGAQRLALPAGARVDMGGLVSWAPRGDVVAVTFVGASGRAEVGFFDARSGAARGRVDGNYVQGWTPDGSFAAVGCSPGANLVRLPDSGPIALVDHLEHGDDAIVLHPRGRHALAMTAVNGPGIGEIPSVTVLRRTAGGAWRPGGPLALPACHVLDWSVDGRVACLRERRGGALHLVDVAAASTRRVENVSTHSVSFPRAAFSPSGRELALSASEVTLLLRTDTAGIQRVFLRQVGWGALRWAPDESRLHAGSHVIYFAGAPPRVLSARPLELLGVIPPPAPGDGPVPMHRSGATTIVRLPMSLSEKIFLGVSAGYCAAAGICALYVNGGVLLVLGGVATCAAAAALFAIVAAKMHRRPQAQAQWAALVAGL